MTASETRWPCPACGAEARLRFRSRDYNRRLSREVFDHFRCPACALVFIAPIPARLGDYYPPAYHAAPATLGTLEAGAPHEQYKIDIVRRFVRTGRLLELGPSLGCFAHLARRSGYEVSTVEMDERCAAFLNDVAGIPTVRSDDVVAALSTLDPFDVIAAWHVIEHLPDPWTALEAIGRKVNPGGIVVLAAPNPAAFQFRVLGRFWPHVDAPRHLSLIPPERIAERMARVGLRLAWTTTTDEGGLGWNVFGWEQFLANLFPHPRLTGRARAAGRTVARVLGPIERVEGRGSAYTMVLRKEA